MRTILCTLATLVFLSMPGYAQTRSSGTGPEQTLMNLERSWAGASLKNDAAALDGILAPNWTGVSTEGKVTTREQALDDMKKDKFTKSEVSEMKVLVLNPTTAVVTGIWTGVGTDAKGQKIDESERWTDVFTNQSGAWKCVASQNTTIKK